MRDHAQADSNLSPWSFLIMAAGFRITIFSIQTINFLLPLLGPQTIILLLLPGPIFGLWALRTLLRPNCGTAARIPRR